MDVNVESMIEGLTSLVGAIKRDRKLQRWFFGLAQKPIVERRNAIYLMSARMAGLCCDAGLVASLKLLVIPKVFDAACLALREAGCG